MGTDIHLYVEKLVDGAWVVVPPPERDLARWPKKEEREWGWGPHGCMRDAFRECYGLNDDDCAGTSCPACAGTGKDLRWYSNRNYDVFAVLADVRNGRGFAGCDTGDGFEVIAPARGVPADASPTVRDHGAWDHTPSWLTVEEILAFDWSRTTTKRGVIPLLTPPPTSWQEDSYQAWRERKSKAPESYCGGVSGPRVVVLDEVQAELLCAKPGVLDPVAFGQTYVRVSWVETYEEACVDFLGFVREIVVPLLGASGVRFVFGFDS